MLLENYGTESSALRTVYGKTLAKLGKSDRNIVVLDADLSKSTKTSIFAAEFPERFFDMGIAEQDMLGTAAGLTLTGKKAFASSFAIFATGRAWEQIRNSICYPKIPVRIVATHAGISVGEDGGSHQALEDIALMRVLPNMKVFVPADSVETESIINYVSGDEIDFPVYVRLGRDKFPLIFDKEKFRFEPGKAQILRQGKDMYFISCGLMTYTSLKASEILGKQGFSAGVINMSSIKPLDKAAVIKAAETGRIITVEEHNIIGGLGSAVAECACAEKPCRIDFIGMNDKFGESGKPELLLDKFGLTPEKIAERALNFLNKK